MTRKDLKKTALILIGYQNDYFSEEGILHGVVENSCATTLENTHQILSSIGSEFGAVISTPIVFTEDYSEIVDATGILKVIKEVGAFKRGSKGSEQIEDLKDYGFVQKIEGKRGLNAFSNTELEQELKARQIEEIVLAGCVTSICIDSTARHAVETGYKVSILKDCTTGRSDFEQQFYCDEIFPLYADVINTQEFIASV